MEVLIKASSVLRKAHCAERSSPARAEPEVRRDEKHLPGSFTSSLTTWSPGKEQELSTKSNGTCFAIRCQQPGMNSLSRIRIQAGMTVESASKNFEASVNQPGAMFSTDSWLYPNLVKFRELLSDPVTGDQAIALLDLLYNLSWIREAGKSSPELVRVP